MRSRAAILFVVVTLLIATLACGEGGTAVPTEDGIYDGAYDGLVFAGKAVNSNTGEWVNGRLVLLFVKSEEIARAVTDVGQYGSLSAGGSRLDGGLGIVDGFFVLRIPNTYGLSATNLGVPLAESPFVQVYDTEIGGWMHPYGLAAWLDPVAEGETREFYIPSKNLRYILKVLPGPLSQLPAEIQQPGSTALLEGNRLVAVDPNAPEPAPSSAFSNAHTRFEQVQEEIVAFPPDIFPLNNCGGGAELKQELTKTYIHAIIDESKTRFGIELPVLDWFAVLLEIEHHYGISDKQITTYSTTLTVPAGQYVEYTIVRKQTWESGVAVVSGEVEISAPYRIQKNEILEVVSSQQKPCP